MSVHNQVKTLFMRLSILYMMTLPESQYIASEPYHYILLFSKSLSQPFESKLVHGLKWRKLK
jgi:hypothetical protein